MSKILNASIGEDFRNQIKVNNQSKKISELEENTQKIEEIENTIQTRKPT